MKCVVIINPKSGKGFNEKLITKIEKVLINYNYTSEIILTEYKGHAKNIVLNLNNDIDLVISVGGDGTFSEVMNGNLLRKKPLVLSHLPVGTANDLGHMYGLGNNIINNLKLILEGVIKDVDIGFINNHAFTYVASFGKFMDIPYKTPQELKKRLGYMAYVLEVFKRIFVKIPKYEVTFTVDNKKHTGKYTFVIISNANRIGGINNFYNDIKLDDNKIEVMFCSLSRKIDILKAFYTLKTSDIEYVSGVEIYKVSEIKLNFFSKDIIWCVDGEELVSDTSTYNIKLKQNVKMQVPRKNISKLFINN